MNSSSCRLKRAYVIVPRRVDIWPPNINVYKLYKKSVSWHLTLMRQTKSFKISMVPKKNLEKGTNTTHNSCFCWLQASRAIQFGTVQFGELEPCDDPAVFCWREGPCFGGFPKIEDNRGSRCIFSKNSFNGLLIQVAGGKICSWVIKVSSSPSQKTQPVCLQNLPIQTPIPKKGSKKPKIFELEIPKLLPTVLRGFLPPSWSRVNRQTLIFTEPGHTQNSYKSHRFKKAGLFFNNPQKYFHRT